MGLKHFLLCRAFLDFLILVLTYTYHMQTSALIYISFLYIYTHNLRFLPYLGIKFLPKASKTLGIKVDSCLMCIVVTIRKYVYILEYIHVYIYTKLYTYGCVNVRVWSVCVWEHVCVSVSYCSSFLVYEQIHYYEVSL